MRAGDVGADQRSRRRFGSPTSVVSAALLSELRRVLAYPKLAAVIDQPNRLADPVETISVVVEPQRAVSDVSDEPDNRLLEAAIEGRADYLISGDKGLLALGAFEGIPTLPPANVPDAQAG
jgi:putative PIN family toxin of toxin-antitoxin system